MSHSVVYGLVGALILAAFLWKVREAWQHGREPARWALAAAILFSATGFTIAVPEIYVWLGGWSGVPNLATLLVYGSITCCTLALSVWTGYMLRPIDIEQNRPSRDVQLARSSRSSLAAAGPILAAMTVLFVAAPVHDTAHPVDFDAHYATEPLVVAFLAIYLTTYVVCLLRIILLGRRYVSLVRELRWLRVGLGLITIGATTAIGYAVGKVVSTAGSWLGHPLDHLNIVVAPAFASIGGAAMALGYVLPSAVPAVIRNVLRLRALIVLRPLWRELYVVDPASHLDATTRRWAVRDRLHRQVVEIRDWLLRLRPFHHAHAEDIASTLVRDAGLPEQDVAPTIEAARIAAALDAWKRKDRAAQAPEQSFGTPTRPGLRGEIEHLVPLARAFKSPVVAKVVAAARKASQTS